MKRRMRIEIIKLITARDATKTEKVKIPII